MSIKQIEFKCQSYTHFTYKGHITMQWSDLSIGKQIRIGFAIILTLLVALGAIGYVGINRMKNNAARVIDGNRLDAILAQNEVDHLNWANALNAFLTDPSVKDLEAAVDENECRLGRWLNGAERAKYEAEIPKLKPLIAALEAPHGALHSSAGTIKKIFKQVDPDLLGTLNKGESDHLRWASTIRQAFLQKTDSLGIETEPDKCEFGQWLLSDHARKIYETGNLEFKKAWDELVVTHKKLHQSASEIERNLAFKAAEDAKASRKRIMARLEGSAKSLNTMLDNFMTEVVRPSRETAEAENNVSELIVWATAEEAINQNIIRGLLEMQRILSQYETEKSETLWKEFEGKLPEYNSGMGIALSTLISKDDIHEKTNEISRISKQYLNDAKEYRGQMLAGIKAEAAISGAQKVLDERTMPLLEKTIAHIGVLKKQVEADLKNVAKAKNIFAAETMPALQKIRTGLATIRKQAKAAVMTDAEMLESVKATQKIVTVVSAVALLIGILFGYLVPRGIIRVLTVISQQMEDAAGQVSSAAGQMSASSQSLANGTTEQAAAIGETASALDGMAVKTQQNESNVREADGLMKEANVIVDEADDAMDDLSESIKEITVASEETQNIIKTIDEIAFQTNLLALNAAVEAARAGEAGAGFSVVADEVRNLAIRAADAAKNTTDLIEGTVRRVKEGAGIVDKTNDAMTKVSQSAQKVGELLSEIAIASHENTSDIDRINKSIAEVDGVTQQNASSAEQSASAAEEMNAQSEQMKELVTALRTMVGGHGIHEKNTGRRQNPMLPYTPIPKKLPPA